MNSNNNCNSNQIINKNWIVIGAGPAGIASIGKLLDKGIACNEIGWIDPEFKVGDIGKKWRTVSSNTTVELFIKFLYNCDSFGYKHCPIDFSINHLSPPHATCLLNEIADPLQWVSDKLRNQVDTYEIMVKSLVKTVDNKWEITTTSTTSTIISSNVIIAPGSEPLSLSLPLTDEQTMITVEQTVNMEELKKVIRKEDTVAVFGSSHTAIIALYNVNEIGSNIINFYRSPLKYAVYKDDWILYDNTGLKGYSATWSKENIENNPISNLERVQIDHPSFNNKLSSCNKIIYAVGFKSRSSNINLSNGNTNTTTEKYNESNGIIEKGLFGIGIGYPQLKADRVGNIEYNVGLWKFMVYLNEALPIWLEQVNKQ